MIYFHWFLLLILSYFTIFPGFAAKEAFDLPVLTPQQKISPDHLDNIISQFKIPTPQTYTPEAVRDFFNLTSNPASEPLLKFFIEAKKDRENLYSKAFSAWSNLIGKPDLKSRYVFAMLDLYCALANGGAYYTKLDDVKFCPTFPLDDTSRETLEQVFFEQLEINDPEAQKRSRIKTLALAAKEGLF